MRIATFAHEGQRRVGLVSADGQTVTPFDLSPAEDRIARALIGGLTLQHCARDFGVSQETVRKQLKGIFAKTGTSRQTDLLRLLASATSLPIRR